MEVAAGAEPWVAGTYPSRASYLRKVFDVVKWVGVAIATTRCDNPFSVAACVLRA